MNKRTGLVCSVAAALLLAGHAQAALNDRGGGLIYDDVQDITWLQDANYAMTSGYAPDGRMSWDEQIAWAANLSYFDSIRGTTYTDWRLPAVNDLGSPGCSGSIATADNDCGSKPAPASSELAHLYYVSLGNLGSPDVGYGISNSGPFINLEGHEGYWFGNEFPPLPTDQAWAFGSSDGHQDNHAKSVALNAWAVRAGDVLAAPIPEPATYATMVAGLLVVGAVVRRRRRREQLASVARESH